MKSRESRPRYSLRKLTIGLASVMFGSVVFAVSANGVSADTIENGATTNQPTTEEVVKSDATSEKATTDNVDDKAVATDTEADQTKTNTSTATSEKAKVTETTDKATAEKADEKGDKSTSVTTSDKTDTTKQNDQKTTATTDQQHDEINWNAVEYTHDNNGVKITGWNIEKGGYDVLLPNTSDFVIHGDITDSQIAEIYEEDMHNIMYALSDNKTLPNGQTFTITISHNNDAHLANNKLHATSEARAADDLHYFQYAFSTEDLTTDNKDKYTNNLVSADLENLDMSNIRDMAGIFQGASKLSDLKVSTWDVSNIRYAEHTFTGTSSLRHVDVNNWQFYQGPKQKVYVEEMFRDSGVEDLDLSKWNTTNYEGFSNMFLNTQNLKTLNISNWDVSNASYKGWLLLFGAEQNKDTSSVRTIIANNFKTTEYGLYPFSPKHPLVIIQDNMDTAPITNYKYWDGDINKFTISLNREQTSDSPVMNLMVQGDVTQEMPKVQMQLNRVLFKNLDDFKHAVIGAVGAAKNYETSLGYNVSKNVGVLRNLPNDVSEIAAFLDNAQPAFQLDMTDKVVEITSPVKKGDLIPDTRDSHYDTDVAESDLSRTITRTINITNPKGETTKTEQTVTFTRQAFVDEATGKVTFCDWSENGKHTFDSVEVPKVAGYTASQAVESVEVTPDSESTTVDVTYTADDGKQTISYVDENGNEVSKQVVNGKTDETVKVTPEVPENWILVDQVPSEVTIKPSDEAIQVKIKHGTSEVTPDKPTEQVTKDDLNKTVTRTINVIDPNGKTTTTKQEVTFTRNATVDKVTGEVTFGDWSENGKHIFDKFLVPEVAGYNASQKEVAQITVTPDSKNIVVTITYKMIPVEEPDLTDNIVATSSNDNTASQGPSQNQAVTGIVMHLAIGYDKLGNKTAVRYRSYTPIKYLPTVVKINGRDFYKLADKDEYVLTTNITGRDRVLTHNAYIYNYKGQRIGTKTFKKGKSLKTYGRHFVLRDGKKYYRVGKGQYIKMAKFR